MVVGPQVRVSQGGVRAVMELVGSGRLGMGDGWTHSGCGDQSEVDNSKDEPGVGESMWLRLEGRTHTVHHVRKSFCIASLAYLAPHRTTPSC